jgi:hypothetical protein
MPNILLTTICNRRCPYCFAKTEMDGATTEEMTWENLIYIADFLVKSREKKVSLLGGEPTLHQDFVDYVCYLNQRGFDVSVFTNGMVSDDRLSEMKENFSGMPHERLSFVCNLNNPNQTPAPDEETRRIHNFLAAMGPLVGPGFNIYRLDFDLTFLFDLVVRYGLKRTLRLGMTHPIPGQGNGYIRPEDMGKTIERLYSFKPLMDRLRIRPGLDCGFPICQFTDEQLGWLYRLSRHAKFECGPAIDITPDMSVYSCFPLSQFHRKSIFDFDDLKQVGDYYAKIGDQIRIELAGIFDSCDGCIHRDEGICSGGGVCQLVNKFVGEATIRLPEIENELHKSHMSA